jgi:hypothetical protein
MYYNMIKPQDNMERSNKTTWSCICVVSSSRSSYYSFAVSFTPMFWVVIIVNSTISYFRCIIVSQNMGVANAGINEGILLF